MKALEQNLLQTSPTTESVGKWYVHSIYITFLEMTISVFHLSLSILNNTQYRAVGQEEMLKRALEELGFKSSYYNFMTIG